VGDREWHASFPIARVEAIISLACGAILNLGVCRYTGKGQGEVSLLHRLWGSRGQAEQEEAKRHSGKGDRSANRMVGSPKFVLQWVVVAPR
jgi:hypothetical protein